MEPARTETAQELASCITDVCGHLHAGHFELLVRIRRLDAMARFGATTSARATAWFGNASAEASSRPASCGCVPHGQRASAEAAREMDG